MAVFCELPVVLEFIQYNTEIYYDTQSDKVAEKLYTADGDDKGIPYSSSMDLAEKARKAKLLEDACEKNEVETIAEKEAAPSRESRAESLEGECKDLNTDISGWFQKVPVAAGEPSTESQLSTTMAKIIRETTVKMIQVQVFLPEGGGAPLRLKLREDATVSEALKHILQEQAKDTASKPLKLPVDVAYHFYMAEGNGTPDTTFPLNAKSILRKFGDTFCLVDNPQFQEDKYRDRKGSEPSRVVRPLLAVHLPNELKTLVPYQADLKISQLLIKICYKRGLDATNHYFSTADSNIPLDERVTMDKLGAKELYLRIGKGADNNAMTVSTDDMDSGPGDDGSGESFQVMRVHRYLKEPLVLHATPAGIFLEKKKKGAGKREHRKLLKAWSDISRMTVGEKAKTVIVEFSDGSRAASFETESEGHAREIVALMGRYSTDN